MKSKADDNKGIKEGREVELVTEYGTFNGTINGMYEEGVEIYNTTKVYLIPWFNVQRIECNVDNK